MTTTDTGWDIFDQTVPIERPSRAPEIRHRVLIAIAAVLVAAGWGTAKVCRSLIATIGTLIWAVGYMAAKSVLATRAGITWSVAAYRVGWDQGMNRES